MAVLQFVNLLLVIILIIQEGFSQKCISNGECDGHELCPTWKDDGECYRSPSYMKRICPASCFDMGIPSRNECIDAHENCALWSQDAECETNNEVKRYCKLSCGSCANIGKKDFRRNDDTQERGRTLTTRTSTEQKDSCKNNHDSCSSWASMGECDKNPSYMLNNCKVACGMCEKTETINGDDESEMVRRTAKFGEMQVVEGYAKEETLDKVKEMLHYMEKSEDYLSLPSMIRSNCRNNNELCSFWAALGECEKNISFMQIQCAPACQTCHFIDMARRCPKLLDSIPALKPGDLNAIFEQIVDTAPGNRTLTDEDRKNLALSEMTEYSVTVHSRPSDDPVTDVHVRLDRELPPWVITLDGFLTDEECDSMIQHGFDAGYKRSEDVGGQKFDGTVDSRKIEGRTSENAWCSTRNGCRGKTVPKRILDRMSTILGIPSENSEDLQILKYEVGQFYKTHHDYIRHQQNRQCGPRILTFFLYLSDVEAGGGTHFPDLGITVIPKKGRAVLWPSVYNALPMDVDQRTRHQALPVEEGVKFGANAWIHMFDYQAPQRIGCN